MVHGIKEFANVRVEYPIHVLRHQCRVKRRQRLVRISSGAKPIGESEEVDLINGIQHFSNRSLYNFIFQCRDTQRPLTAIGLGDKHAAYRQRPVAPGVDLCAERLQIAPQMLLVDRHRHPVDSRARVPFEPCERARQGCDIDMMEQRRKAGVLVVPRCIVHPLEMWQHGDPALCPDRGSFQRVPFTPAPSL